MYQYWNPNPAAAKVGDCTVRAISKAMGQTLYNPGRIYDLYRLGICKQPPGRGLYFSTVRARYSGN